MKTIIKRYLKQFGYNPTLAELQDLYTRGLIRLSDKEENSLINAIEKNNKTTTKNK